MKTERFDLIKKWIKCSIKQLDVKKIIKFCIRIEKGLNCMNSIPSLCARKTLIINSGNIIYCIIPTAAALKITA